MTNSHPPGPPLIPAMERVVGRILFAGVSVSVCCLAAGLLWQWASIGHPRFDYELPHTHIARFLLGEVTALVHGRVSPARLINLGILALLLTPYLRVVLSMVCFVAIERNYKYGIITGFVGAILTYSLFLR